MHKALIPPDKIKHTRVLKSLFLLRKPQQFRGQCTVDHLSRDSDHPKDIGMSVVNKQPNMSTLLKITFVATIQKYSISFIRRKSKTPAAQLTSLSYLVNNSKINTTRWCLHREHCPKAVALQRATTWKGRRTKTTPPPTPRETQPAYNWNFLTGKCQTPDHWLWKTKFTSNHNLA